MDNDGQPETTIPDKLYYKIGEVTDITGLAGYVLRFWESEFKTISPRRTESGQRLYRKTDIEAILKIKHLLYERKFTIPGARKHLKSLHDPKSTPPGRSITSDELRSELLSIRDLLNK